MISPFFGGLQTVAGSRMMGWLSVLFKTAQGMPQHAEINRNTWIAVSASLTFTAKRQSRYVLFVFFYFGARRLTYLALDAGVKDYSQLYAL